MLGNTGDATAAAPVQALLRDGCVLIQAFGFQQRLFRWRAAERRHPTGRERTGSPTSQTLQEPIVPLPLVCIRRGRFSSEGSSNLFPGLRKDFWIIMGTPPKGDALCSSARADHSGMPPPFGPLRHVGSMRDVHCVRRGAVTAVALGSASCVVAPLLEELFWRGFFFPSLTRSMSTPLAVRLNPATSSSR
jgi:hypothetical protein